MSNIAGISCIVGNITINRHPHAFCPMLLKKEIYIYYGICYYK